MNMLTATLLSMMFATPAWSSQVFDLERERRLGEEMSANLFDGEVVELDAAGHSFLAAYIEKDEPRGSVILLHGRGFHADWPEVVGPLRVALAEAGWSTLSLQMPVLGKEATYYDYVPTFDAAAERIDAGIRYMRQRVDGPLVLFAHSCGAHMAMHWIYERGDRAIDAMIGAGMGATDWGQDLVRPFPIERIAVPLLDVLGTEEYERVLDLAAARAELLAEKNSPITRQLFVDGADHYFKGRNRELADAVIDWLEAFDRP